MKIAYLAYHYIQAVHFFNIVDKLNSCGHEATVFYQEDFIERQHCQLLNWEKCFLVDMFDSYDQVVIFNGYAPETFLYTSALKSRLGHKMFFAEKAWLPQKNNIYIDPEGLGGRSSLSKINLSQRQFSKSEWRAIEDLYKQPFEYNKSGFILIPTQLDWDSSITLDSHTVKTCNSLIKYVSVSFPDEQIVVRPHPLLKDYPRLDLPNVVYDDVNPTVKIAQHAKAIIGINSTVMIESLVHFKPIMFFGEGVLNSTPDVCLKFDGSNIEDVLSFVPDAVAIKKTLCHLKSLQLPIE